MSTPDSLLVAWWLLTGALCVLWFLFTKWVRIANQRTAASIALKGDRLGHSGPALPAMAILRTIAVVTGLMILVWLAGLIAFTWMSYWTGLLFVNFRLFGVLLGVSFLLPSVSAMVGGYAAWAPRWVMRPLMIVFGLAVIAIGSYSLVGDLVPPRLIIEGQVNSVSHSWAKGDKYSIVIDGKRYETLRVVFLTVSEGDHVRAELGAASKTILRAEPIRSRAQ